MFHLKCKFTFLYVGVITVPYELCRCAVRRFNEKDITVFNHIFIQSCQCKLSLPNVGVRILC